MSLSKEYLFAALQTLELPEQVAVLEGTWEDEKSKASALMISMCLLPIMLDLDAGTFPNEIVARVRKLAEEIKPYNIASARLDCLNNPGNLPQMEFSIDSMSRCNGNASCDRPYAVFFCAEALRRASEAAKRLEAMADSLVWSDNVRAECESLRGLVVALHRIIAWFAEFFSLKFAMAEPFVEALPKLQKLEKEANEVAAKIFGWLEKQ